LTEDASEVAVGEEDGPGPFPPCQGYLFTKMGVGGINLDSARSTAKPLFADQPIHTTLSGAEPAFPENRISLINSTGKLAILLQFLVCRGPFLRGFFSRTEKPA
jgi:hypothetical protein